MAILDAKLKADEALALIGGRTAVDEPAGPAAIRSAFLIEADQTLTAAECLLMTEAVL